MKDTWRYYANRTIKQCFDENPELMDFRQNEQSMKAIRKKLKDAYPFGERQYHPYKIWCSEVRFMLGLSRRNTKGQKIQDSPKEQINIFE